MCNIHLFVHILKKVDFTKPRITLPNLFGTYWLITDFYSKLHLVKLGSSTLVICSQYRLSKCHNFVNSSSFFNILIDWLSDILNE